MAKKITEQNQDSIQAERIYKSENNSIEWSENSSKRRFRNKLIDAVGKIATGRRKEGIDQIRRATRDRVEDNTRNSARKGANEALHKLDQVRYGGLPVQGTQAPVVKEGVQGTVRQQGGTDYSRPPQNAGEFQVKGNSRGIPDTREGANGMTVEQLTKLNELKKTDPAKYRDEMQRIFGTGKGQAPAVGEELKQGLEEKRGLKL